MQRNKTYGKESLVGNLPSGALLGLLLEKKAPGVLGARGCAVRGDTIVLWVLSK